MEQLFSIKGKKIILVGCSRGIGAGILQAYAEAGATVSAMDWKAEPCLEQVKKANELGAGKVTFQELDISSRSNVDKAFQKAYEEMGGLDVLVNVAGVQHHFPPNDVKEENFDFIFKTNIFGTMNTNGAAYNLMVKSKAGAIINFASDSGIVAAQNNMVYGASKGGVICWTRSVARQWGPDGIRVNCICPYIATELYYDFISRITPEEAAAYAAELKAQIPLGGKPGDAYKDLAPVLVFLASDASHFITGQMIPIDGGYLQVR